ncbi:MAG: SRPBCC family protein [Myxococcota bacterium]
MSRFCVSERIPRPVEEVWAFVTDFAGAPRWMRAVDRMWVDGAGPVGEGTSLVFESRGAERRCVVSAWEPTRRLALRSTQGGVTATYVYGFEAEGSGTRVELEAIYEFRGAIRLVAPLIGWLVRRTDGGQLRALAATMQDSP